MKRILPVYPWPMHSKIAAELALIPDLMPIEALPGGPGPVLCIRKVPPFMADCIVVDQQSALASGLRIALADGIRMVTVRDKVSEIFGIQVVEKADVELTPAQRAVQFV